MQEKKADARSGNCERPKSFGQARSIVANKDVFRLTAWSLAFLAACLAVPTVMAVLKQWGWW